MFAIRNVKTHEIIEDGFKTKLEAVSKAEEIMNDFSPKNKQAGEILEVVKA